MVFNYVSMQGVPLYAPAVIGDLALQSSNSVDITGGSIAGITDLAVADGGTGASTAAEARANLGISALGNWTTLSLTFGPLFYQEFAGAHPCRVRVNEFLRLVLVEFSVNSPSVSLSLGDEVFSWSASYGLPAGPHAVYKYASIEQAVSSTPRFYVEGSSLKIQPGSAPMPIGHTIGDVLYIY